MAEVSLADFLAAHHACSIWNLRRAIIRCAIGPLREELCKAARAWEPDDADGIDFRRIILLDDPLSAADPGEIPRKGRAVPNSVKYSLRKLEAWLLSIRERRRLEDDGWSFDDEDDEDDEGT
jgi:hypothetical protein